MSNAVSQLHESITEGLHDLGLPGVQVEVAESGEVTLTGEIDDPGQEAEAIDVAFTRGAADVHSRLTYAAGSPTDSYLAREQHERPPPGAADQSKRTYEVQKSDSWWRIAQKHWGDGRKHPALRQANPDVKALHPGVVLVVPGIEDDATYHVVQQGESYWAIAQRYYGDGRRHEEIKAANPDIGGLHPGKVLRIPPKA